MVFKDHLTFLMVVKMVSTDERKIWPLTLIFELSMSNKLYLLVARRVATHLELPMAMIFKKLLL